MIEDAGSGVEDVIAFEPMDLQPVMLTRVIPSPINPQPRQHTRKWVMVSSLRAENGSIQART